VFYFTLTMLEAFQDQVNLYTRGISRIRCWTMNFMSVCTKVACQSCVTLVCRTVHAVLGPGGYQFLLCQSAKYTRTAQCVRFGFIVLDCNK
jgi:hypothetical protein